MRRASTLNELKQVTDKKLDECSYNEACYIVKKTEKMKMSRFYVQYIGFKNIGFCLLSIFI